MLALLVSGCLSSGDGGDPAAPAAQPPGAIPGTGIVAAANNTTAPELPITLELQGCLQLHTFFTYPSAVFSSLGFQVPDGFQLDSADGQTVDVLLAWWFCAGGLLNNTPNAPFSDVGSMFAAIPVIPPSELTAGDPQPVAAHDYLPLTWVVTSQLAADHLGDIEGLRDGYVEKGPVTPTSQNEAGAVATYSAAATASFGVFTVDCAIQPQPGGFEASRYRIWLAPDGAATGYLDVRQSAGQALGGGVADLRFNGDADAGAPPATGGTSHVVDGIGVVLAYVSLGAQ